MSDDSIHLRNAKALHEGLKIEVGHRERLQERVDQLERQLAMFKNIIQDMDQQVKVMRAQRTTTGPTTR